MEEVIELLAECGKGRDYSPTAWAANDLHDRAEIMSACQFAARSDPRWAQAARGVDL